MLIEDVLRNCSFGSRTAEEEQEKLASYFVQTEQWQRVLAGQVDVVYGSKGSGKSAIYTLILKSVDQLAKNKITAIAAEKPEGTTFFSSIAKDMPEDEQEFTNLWKLYILTLVGKSLREYGVDNDDSRKVLSALESAKLIPTDFTLGKMLKYAYDYIKNFRIAALDGAVSVDPITMAPTAAGKIVFAEPDRERADLGAVLVDDLLQAANNALAKQHKIMWILLDRLDIAFSQSSELEAIALKALFKCYLDTKHLNMIRPKIFLRTDIWENITRHGFREASHIEKSLTLRWNAEDLKTL